MIYQTTKKLLLDVTSLTWHMNPKGNNHMLEVRYTVQCCMVSKALSYRGPMDLHMIDAIESSTLLHMYLNGIMVVVM